MSVSTGKKVPAQRRNFRQALGWHLENLVGGLLVMIICILALVLVAVVVSFVLGLILAIIAVLVAFPFAPLVLAFWYPPEIYLSSTGAWAVFWAWVVTEGVRSSIEEDERKGKDPFAFFRD